MRIHPWCSVFVGSGTDFGKAHPEFIGLNNNGENTGNFLCAAREEVQDWDNLLFFFLLGGGRHGRGLDFFWFHFILKIKDATPF